VKENTNTGMHLCGNIDDNHINLVSTMQKHYFPESEMWAFLIAFLKNSLWAQDAQRNRNQSYILHLIAEITFEELYLKYRMLK